MAAISNDFQKLVVSAFYFPNSDFVFCQTNKNSGMAYTRVNTVVVIRPLTFNEKYNSKFFFVV